MYIFSFLPKIIKNMKGNKISSYELRADALEWLQKSRQVLIVKEYGKSSLHKQMTLGHAKFLRRFEQHILPKGFVMLFAVS